MMSTVVGVAMITAITSGQSTIVSHPDDLVFEEYAFGVPVVDPFRRELPNGTPVYIAVDHELPLISITLVFEGGAWLDDPDMLGVATMTGSMMRRGGTTSVTPDVFDEEVAFLAADISAGVGGLSSSAQLSCLSTVLDEAFPLFIDMVQQPGFDQEKLDLHKDDVLEGMRQRNDDAGTLSSRARGRLFYGEDHLQGSEATGAMIESITVTDLRGMHHAIFTPSNMIVAVSGDFDPETMMARLQEAFENWESGSAVVANGGVYEDAGEIVPPGLYHVEKDIPQSKVIVGTRSITRDDPDFFAATLLNDILGGGGFQSRLTNRIRTQEGLAYSAGSRLSTPVHFPGVIVAGFDTRNEKVARAIEITLEEMANLQTKNVTEEELSRSKASFIETFPQTFGSKAQTIGVFVEDEMTDRPVGYWEAYRARVGSVTADDVRRVAQRLLDPEAMVILVVGPWDEVINGDGTSTISSVVTTPITHLPPRDPMTLEPLPSP
jgi:zinc protease